MLDAHHHRNLLQPAQTLSAPSPRRAALLAKGFRPFFLGALVFAVVAVPAWLAVFAGLPVHSLPFPPLYWHAHEMLFGFTLAVIAGFLLTAVSNWTGRETLVGAPLGALAGLWLLGRIAMLWPAQDSAVRVAASLVDLAFAPLLALAIARPIVATRNARNAGFIVVLLGFFLANLWMHLGALGVAPRGLNLGSRLALDLIVLVIVVITGRVIPMFTRNATTAKQARSIPALQRAAVVSVALMAVGDLLPLASWMLAALAGIAGSFVLLRARHWGLWASLSQPLLWVLHVGHLWIGIGLLLKAASLLGIGGTSTWVHALTVGGIGLLTIGMMVRVTLGHTGRMLAPPKPAVIGFVAITLSAIVRVVAPELMPVHFLPALLISGALWCGSCVAVLAACALMLLTPRVDGRPG